MKNKKKISKYKFVWFVKQPLVAFVVEILLIPSLFTSCTKQNQNDNLLIAVSIPPQAWFVSEIAGDKAETLILVPPGQNPHNYEPTPKQIQSLSKASAWILSGTEFEISLRPKIEKLFPDLLIVDGTEGVKNRYLTEKEYEYDIHIEEHDMSYNMVSFLETYRDRHTWLGYDPAVNMAMKIATSLAIIDYQNSDYYFEQMDDLIKKIDLVYNKLRDTLAPLEGKKVFVYHPSFGYFLDEFGIIQEAVEMGGKEPTPRQLNGLIEKIKEEKPAAIFVQKQFPSKAAKKIADAVGAQVIELDPLAGNWLENIMNMGQELKKVIK